MPSSRGSSQPRGWNHVSYLSCTDGWVLYHLHNLGNSIICIGQDKGTCMGRYKKFKREMEQLIDQWSKRCRSKIKREKWRDFPVCLVIKTWTSSARVSARSLTRELRSHMLHGVAKKKKKKRKKERKKERKERDREESEALREKREQNSFFSLRQEEEKISEGLEASR